MTIIRSLWVNLLKRKSVMTTSFVSSQQLEAFTVKAAGLKPFVDKELYNDDLYSRFSKACKNDQPTTLAEYERILEYEMLQDFNNV